jgi:hypothetical protein
MTISRVGIWIVNAALFALCCFLMAGLANAWIAEWLATAPLAAPPPLVASGAPTRHTAKNFNSR